MDSEPEFTNRLIHEKSPYLLQHAHNPVDWYPWGEEAFDRAKKEDKPIFLSIGYATCHWCHVMEHESFQNQEIAELLNKSFVNIKVDREEMPEVDSVYMDLAQALMVSSGGWPLNLVLTPDLKPFFAVTYLPPEGQRGMMGFPQVIKQIHEIWHSSERERIVEQADKIVELFASNITTTGTALPTEVSLEKGIETMYEIADPVYGGIKGEPKFPLSYQLEFLLNYARAHSDSRALFLVELTLDQMARGGIYDQLGGGFSRYSVDERWMIPHFEKMLYDNALLASAYTHAWRFTRTPRYQELTEEILRYVLRDMTSEEGGFYSAQDADTEGQEGRYYTWTPAEIKLLIPSPDAERVCLYYGVGPEGNFEGRSVLHVETPLELLAPQLHIPVEELRAAIQRSKAKLLEKRAERPQPFKDDKILSAWNGLMIYAMVEAGQAFGVKEFLDAAVKCGQFLKKTLWKDGRLLRRYREGDARFSAGLEEYAFLIKGVLALFQAGKGTEFLQWAIDMARIVEQEFKAPDGAFYQTDGKESLLLRKCELYDGAEPSDNAVLSEVLVVLYQITHESRYLHMAEDIFKVAKQLIEAYPPGAGYHMLALQRYYDTKAPIVVIVLDEAGSLRNEIETALRDISHPHLTTIWKTKDDLLLPKLLPWTEELKPVDGTTVYICEQDRCKAPLHGPEEILSAIRKL